MNASMAHNENEMTPEELESAKGEPLPDREAMTILPIAPGGEFFTLPVEPPADYAGDETLPVEPPASA